MIFYLVFYLLSFFDKKNYPSRLYWIFKISLPILKKYLLFHSNNICRPSLPTYIFISLFFVQCSGPDESIETTAERRTSDDILNKYCSPLKSTEIFKDITATDKKPVNNNEKENQQPQQQSRKISFTTEKTIMVNMNDNEKPSTKKADQAKFRKVSIDINYVYEQQQESKPSRMNIHDEKLNDNETGNCQT